MYKKFFCEIRRLKCRNNSERDTFDVFISTLHTNKIWFFNSSRRLARGRGAILLKFCPTWQNLLGTILSRNSPTFEVNFEHAKTVYFLDSQKLQARLRSKKNPNSYLAIRGCYRLETSTSKSLWQKSFVHDVNFQSLLTSAKNFSSS